MKPESFDGVTKVLTSPPNWNKSNRGRCLPLPVRFQDGACISCWSLTEEERLAVAAGKNIYVHVLSGSTQPPIMLTVEDVP